MAALDLLDEFLAKEGSLDDLTVDKEAEVSKCYFVDIPNGDFSRFKSGDKIKKKVETFNDVAAWTPSTLEKNKIGVEPGVKPRNKEMACYFGANVSIEQELPHDLVPGAYYTLILHAVKSAERAECINMEMRIGTKKCATAITPRLSKKWCRGELQYQVPANIKEGSRLTIKISVQQAWSQVTGIQLHVGDSPGAYRRTTEKKAEPSELDKREATVFPKENRLNTGWSIWEHRKQTGRFNGDAYLDSLVRVADFRTVERFWQHWQQLPLPSEFFHDGSGVRPFSNRQVEGLSVFREGVEPKWEDPKNEDGGEWYFRKGIQAEKFDMYWEEAVLAMIGETLDPGTEEICGLRIVDKSKGSRNIYRLELWFRQAPKGSPGPAGEEIKRRLEDCLSEKGGNPPNFEFRLHK